jgi:hypothetical protein
VSKRRDSELPDRITRRSQASVAADLDGAIDWLSNLLGREAKGRIREYQSTLSNVLRRALENRFDILRKELSDQDFVNTYFEARAIIDIWKAFSGRESAQLVDKLRKVLKGNEFTQDEGKVEPRNTLFELEIAGLFIRAALGVDFGDPNPDVITSVGDVPLYCECKRVQTPAALTGNFEEAESQLRDAIGKVGGERKPRGIIAVNVSKIWHLDLEGSPRFPSAIINGLEFPSYIVVAANDEELSKQAGRRAEEFVWLHASLWHRAFEQGVIGAIFYFRVPRVSLSQRAGTFICTYPVLVVFPNFSESEAALMESFKTALHRNHI